MLADHRGSSQAAGPLVLLDRKAVSPGTDAPSSKRARGGMRKPYGSAAKPHGSAEKPYGFAAKPNAPPQNPTVSAKNPARIMVV